MSDQELKEIVNYKQKFLNERKINRILKQELEREKTNCESQIEILKNNHKQLVQRIQNEYNFNLKSIKLEYNNLKLESINKQDTWREYIYKKINVSF
jgi:hypothetical protein